MLDNLLSYLPDNLMGYLQVAVAVIAASSVFAAAIAKLTKNTKDDKVAAILVKIHDFLAKLGLHPPLAVKQAGQAVVVKEAADVRDHRSAK